LALTLFEYRIFATSDVLAGLLQRRQPQGKRRGKGEKKEYTMAVNIEGTEKDNKMTVREGQGKNQREVENDCMRRKIYERGIRRERS
jgi:hypothetical protein